MAKQTRTVQDNLNAISCLVTITVLAILVAFIAAEAVEWYNILFPLVIPVVTAFYASIPIDVVVQINLISLIQISAFIGGIVLLILSYFSSSRPELTLAFVGIGGLLTGVGFGGGLAHVQIGAAEK